MDNNLRDDLAILSVLTKKINILTIITILSFVIIFIQQIFIFNHISTLKKKIDHRYFNVTNSLQDIHNVEIETKQGRVVKLFNTK